MWLGTLLLALCFVCHTQGAPKEYIKAGFLYIGEISDFGWNFAHDQGRVYVQDVAYRGKLYADYEENLAVANLKSKVAEWMAQDYDLIISTSFDFQFDLADVAAEALQNGKDTKFAAVAGYLTSPNMVGAFAKIEQGRYLTGLLAGHMSQSGIACYVAAWRGISEVTQGVNAFTIGFREVVPDGKVYVYILNTWGDDALERRGAEMCHQDHPEADVFTQHADGLEVEKYAKSIGAYGIGYNSDMRIFVGENVLSSPQFVWGPIYQEILRRVYEDDWVPNDFILPGIAESAVKIASFSNRVPGNVSLLIEQRRQEIASDPTKDVFCSPLIADGSLGTLDANGCLTREQISTLSVYVEGAVFSANVTIPPPEEIWLEFSAPVSIAFLTVAAFGILICFVLILLFFFWKSNKHFKASSIDFLVIINIGTIIGLVSIFLLVGEPVAAQCQGFLWLIGTAFILVYGSILIKTFRIWRIFESTKKIRGGMRIKPIPLWILLGVLLVFLILDYTILIVWTAVDYPTIITRESKLLGENQVIKECHWEHYSEFLAAFLGFKGFLIVVGSVLSWRARKIHIPAFNESKHIGLMIYNLLVIGTVLVSIQQTVELSLDANFAIIAVLIEWIGIGGTFILFVPKIYNHLMDKRKGSSKSFQPRDSYGANNGSTPTTN